MISEHPDFEGFTPLPQNSSTTPEFKYIKVWRKSEQVLQLQGIFEKVGVDYYYEAEAWQSPWKNAASFYI